MIYELLIKTKSYNSPLDFLWPSSRVKYLTAIEALNLHHQEQKHKSKMPATYNPSRFFMNSSADNIPAPVVLNAVYFAL